MAASSSSSSAERNQPLLQLQEVDSSRVGVRVLSSSSSSPARPPLDATQPICIPSPYTDHLAHHDFAAIPFYGPAAALFSYASAAASLPVDCPSSVRQSMSPSLFWPRHGHMGAPLPLHRPPSCPQHGQALHGPWVEMSSSSSRDSALMDKSKMARKRSQDSEETVVSSGGKADLHFCAVCHDYASGYHYGVWSCEGCKAFFKRSIQGHNDYICPATNQCTIDKNRRKSCQACRLRKCYETGMTKCGMRRDRGNCRNSQMRRVPRYTSEDGAKGSKTEVLTAVAVDAVQPNQPRPAQLTSEQLIGRIMEAEPPEILLMRDMRRPLTEAHVMMSLTNLADKELVHMISWAKKIPGFVELGLVDQVHLLECCWLEVLMIGLMWRSVDHPGKLIFSADLSLNREEGSCVQGFAEIFDMLLAATSRVRELKLQREEYVCLKAMILLNANILSSSSEGSDELQSRTKLLRLLDAVTDALVWAIAKTGLTFRQQSSRLAHLLMLLINIRHISNKGMDHLHCMKMKNMVPLYDLLLEMLDAHIMHSSRLPREPEPDGSPRESPPPLSHSSTNSGSGPTNTTWTSSNSTDEAQ